MLGVERIVGPTWVNGPGLPALGPVAAAAGVEDVLAQHVPEACTVETPDETGTVGSEGLGGAG